MKKLIAPILPRTKDRAQRGCWRTSSMQISQRRHCSLRKFASVTLPPYLCTRSRSNCFPQEEEEEEEEEEQSLPRFASFHAKREEVGRGRKRKKFCTELPGVKRLPSWKFRAFLRVPSNDGS